MGSSFEDLVARNTTAKTDFDLNIRFESYAFLKFRSDLQIFIGRFYVVVENDIDYSVVSPDSPCAGPKRKEASRARARNGKSAQLGDGGSQPRGTRETLGREKAI